MIFVNKILAPVTDKDQFYDITDALEEQGMGNYIEKLQTHQSGDELLMAQCRVYEASISNEDDSAEDGEEEEEEEGAAAAAAATLSPLDAIKIELTAKVQANWQTESQSEAAENTGHSPKSPLKTHKAVARTTGASATPVDLGFPSSSRSTLKVPEEAESTSMRTNDEPATITRNGKKISDEVSGYDESEPSGSKPCTSSVHISLHTSNNAAKKIEEVGTSGYKYSNSANNPGWGATGGFTSVSPTPPGRRKLVLGEYDFSDLTEECENDVFAPASPPKTPGAPPPPPPGPGGKPPPPPPPPGKYSLFPVLSRFCMFSFIFVKKILIYL